MSIKRKKRVLAIDDEPAMTEWLKILLEHAGYEVRTALIGTRGEELFKTWRPDAVVTDMMLPDVDGIELVRKFKQLDPEAANALAINQLVLGGALLLYAIFSLWNVFRGPSVITEQIASSPELTQAGLGSIESLARMIGVLIYGTLAAVAIFGQGGTALYYFTRRKYVEAYRRETPQWILDAQRAGMPM